MIIPPEKNKKNKPLTRHLSQTGKSSLKIIQLLALILSGTNMLFYLLYMFTNSTQKNTHTVFDSFFSTHSIDNVFMPLNGRTALPHEYQP